MSSPDRFLAGLVRCPTQSLARVIAAALVARANILAHDLYAVESEPDRFLLLEQWESEAALDAHDATAHMAAQDAANAEFRAGPARVLRLSSGSVAQRSV